MAYKVVSSVISSEKLNAISLPGPFLVVDQCDRAFPSSTITKGTSESLIVPFDDTSLVFKILSL